jgi:predicted Holliday junction resolvase-like endonuclease
MELALIVVIICFLIALSFLVRYEAKYQELEKRYFKVTGMVDDYNRKVGELQSQLSDVTTSKITAEHNLAVTEEDFRKLQHQKISADVKLGAKTENLLPFLSQFPYNTDSDEIRGLFNPIDLIVFRDEEVVFIEIKSGQSQLSDKQRRIRDNIKNGRVRFEVHRVDEKGVKVK